MDSQAWADPCDYSLVWQGILLFLSWKCLNQGDESLSASMHFNYNYPSV